MILKWEKIENIVLLTDILELNTNSHTEGLFTKHFHEPKGEIFSIFVFKKKKKWLKVRAEQDLRTGTW